MKNLICWLLKHFYDFLHQSSIINLNLRHNQGNKEKRNLERSVTARSMQLTTKLDKVATLVTYPPPANFTTKQNTFGLRIY